MTCCTSGWSQVVVERSKEKVVISGVPYYLHQVKKGETPYSISRAYGITTNDLARENPGIAEGIKEGQSLRIPVRLVSSAPPAAPTVPAWQGKRDEIKYIYHVLQPGETIYSLSKRYSVSEADIVQSNPGIDIHKLSTGAELAIPRNTPLSTVQNPVQNQVQKPFQNQVQQVERAYYHKVQNGETMASIARHYGISVRELRRGNRDTRFPQVGDSLRIPGMRVIIKKSPEKSETDSLEIPETGEEIYLGRLTERTPVNDLTGTLNVAVLLPFYLYENSVRNEIDSSKFLKGKRIYTETSRSNDWIYPGSLGFLEMYEGILLAADTLRSLGLDINMYVYDIKEDTIEVTNLIRSGRLDRMDLIIGPVHSRNLSIVAGYARTLGIPVVSPVQLLNNSVLIDNPTLFVANSSLVVAQNAIARKIGDYYKDNIILIHTDTLNNDIFTMPFKYKILYELMSRNPLGDLKFHELVFRNKSAAGFDPESTLSHLLSDSAANIVVIASEDAPVMSEAVQEVYNLSRKYEITAFGYPEMRLLKNIDPKFLFDLGLMIYSPYWIDYSRPEVKQFCSDFLTKFHTQPSEMSYAWEGYDVAYYFLSGLAIHGRGFIEHPEIHNPDLLYTEFDFRRSSASDGFENQKLFLIRYTNNCELELIEDRAGFSSE